MPSPAGPCRTLDPLLRGAGRGGAGRGEGSWDRARREVLPITDLVHSLNEQSVRGGVPAGGLVGSAAGDAEGTDDLINTDAE